MGVLKLEDISYNYSDYKLWEGNWELINGIAIAMSPAPMRKHQGLASAIIAQIYEQLSDCEKCEVLGEVDYKIGENTVLRPDIVLTCNEQNDSYLTKAPEIIVEIISKSTAKRDENYKVYKLDEKKYDKQGDFSNETYDFEETTCRVSLDFERVFKRFR